MPKTLVEALKEAIEFLEKHNYRYAIVGGLALPYWASARFTYDIDIKVLIPDTNYFAARKCISEAFPENAREKLPKNPLILSVLIGSVTVDFLFTVPGYEELIIERASRRDLGGWDIWVCSAEDLVIQKAIARREKDWLDIETILFNQYHLLDYDYILGWLTQFSEALENPEILARYQVLVEKVEQYDQIKKE